MSERTNDDDDGEHDHDQHQDPSVVQTYKTSLDVDIISPHGGESQECLNNLKGDSQIAQSQELINQALNESANDELVHEEISPSVRDDLKDSLIMQPQESLNQPMTKIVKSSLTIDIVNTNQISSKLSKKVKLIKYYYLPNSSDEVGLEASLLSLNSEFQHKYK